MSIQLYDYQEKAKEAVLSHFEAHAEALIVMACGLGKTYLAAAILAELLIRLIDEISKSDKPERKPRTLVLCHNNEILEQSRISFHEVLGDSVTTGLFHGGEKDFEEVDILFASIQTMNVWKEAFLVDEFDVVIMDECHHVMASTYLPTVTYFKPKYHMGLTATPDRMDGLEIRDVFGQEVVNIPLSLALARSYLTLVEYHIKNGNLCKGELKKLVKDEFEEGKAISKRISTKQLNETIFIERRDEEIARIILEEDLQAIIFCERIEHAENFSQFIPGSETVHCEKTPRQNSDIIDRFRRKELQYILVVDKLNEGVDIPSAELIVFLRCTDSIPLFIQQLGRGLRKAKGKDKIKVFDFVSNADRLQFVSVFAREVKASCHDDLEQDVLQLSGDGFEFSFSEELQDMLQILESIVPVYISDVPELLAEYDPERNELPADQVFACTGKKLWWKCGKCGHEWQATGANRVYGTGCPACASKVVTATNNLTVTHPHLATEYMDGNELPVGQVIAGTNKKLWWKCSKCGHEWQAKGNTRSSGAGCPACAGQVATATNNLTVTHPHLATEYMDKNKLPVDQVIAGTNKKLWWKCSKCGHEWQAMGSKRVKGNGCPACAGRVVTVTNNLTITHPRLAAEYMDRNELPASKIIAGTSKRLWWKCGKCGYEWQTTGNARAKAGRGCLVCAGQVATATNNLTVTHPHLATEYMDKNKLPVDQVIAGTNKKLWWKCSKCGHEWQATGANRVLGTVCPACIGKTVTATNNLIVTHPQLAEEYMDRNVLPADQVIAKANKKFWWKCSECGHEWRAVSYGRMKGSGCPQCAINRRRKKK